MTDKSMRKATAKRCGNVIVIHMDGGEDCLWLNMYLDEHEGQMTCDSDIGSYAYHWGRNISKSQSWTDFCCQWLSNSEWLLRKCCGERKTERAFDRKQSINNLREYFKQTNENADEQEKFEEVLEIAEGYDDERSFAVALNVAADERRIDLPEEWWNCLDTYYTPWQRRFAEICREVIVPAIRAMEACEEDMTC